MPMSIKEEMNTLPGGEKRRKPLKGPEKKNTLTTWGGGIHLSAGGKSEKGTGEGGLRKRERCSLLSMKKKSPRS